MEVPLELRSRLNNFIIFIYLFIYLFICSFIYLLFIHLLIYLFIYLFIYSFIYFFSTQAKHTMRFLIPRFTDNVVLIVVDQSTNDYNKWEKDQKGLFRHLLVVDN